MSPSAQGSESRKQKQLANAKAWEAEFRRKCQPLRPIKIGCIWRLRATDDADVVSKDEQLLDQFSAISLVELPISVETVTSAEKPQESQSECCLSVCLQVESNAVRLPIVG